MTGPVPVGAATIWCEHCRNHYPADHYVRDGGGHGIGAEFGRTGELLEAEAKLAAIRVLCGDDDNWMIETARILAILGG